MHHVAGPQTGNLYKYISSMGSQRCDAFIYKYKYIYICMYVYTYLCIYTYIGKCIAAVDLQTGNVHL